MKAIWNKQIIAESDETIEFDGYYYFPPTSIIKDFFSFSETYSVCTCKGQASFYTIMVKGQVNINAAWFYLKPIDGAKNITNYIAFCKGIEIAK